MPEIWDDPVAYRESETSFFKYLEFVAQNPGNRPRAPGRILKVLGAPADVPAAEAKERHRAHLATNGFSARPDGAQAVAIAGEVAEPPPIARDSSNGAACGAVPSRASS